MCVNIANVLHENSYDVHVCATRSGGTLEKFIYPGIKCYILKKRKFADISAFRQFIKVLKTENIDLVHAHSSSVFWAVAAKLYIKKLKVIWHDHLGIRINDRRKNFFYKIISLRIDGIIAVNKDLTGWSRKNMKVAPDRIVLINNFPLLRKAIRHPDPTFITIVCLANLRPQKDHETLIKAIGILKKGQLPKKLKVIFAGAYKEEKYFFSLKDLIKELGLSDIIDIAGSVEDTAALLATADCGVLSSVSEGLPVSLLEYGLASLPVVVTDVGQCAEVVGHGEFGRVVPPGDPQSLAKELSWIIHNPGMAFQMGSAFRKHVVKEYSLGQFLAKYQSLLNKICKG